MLGKKAAQKSAAQNPGVPEVFGAAIQGARSEQQDAYRLRWIENEEAWLLVLADGMGGHAGGGTASKIAVDGFVAAFVSKRSRGAMLEDAFQAALNDANLRIAQAQQAEPDLADMGTTLVAAHLSQAGVSWISVGDSPMWICRDGRLRRLNEDHSLREIAGSAKNLSNMLQSVLNGAPIPMVDCQAAPVALRPGDVLLIASDGILTLDEDEIAATLQQLYSRGASSVGNSLLDLVSEYQRSNQDNCSVIVAFPAGIDVADGSKVFSRFRLPAVGLQDAMLVGASAIAGFVAVLAVYFIFFAH
jgi:serine/threonine protein phosphatase PrpC